MSSKPEDHKLYHESVKFAKEGEFDQALTAIDKAILIDPSHAPSFRLKARILNAHGRKQEALDCIDISIKCDINYAPSYDNKGVFLIQQAKIDESLKCFQQALHIDPKFTLAMTHIGDVYKLQSHEQKSHQQYQIALSSDPNDALALCGLGKFEDAMKILEDPTKNERYPKPHRLYIDSCLKQIKIQKQVTDEIKQMCSKIACVLPQEFTKFTKEVDDFEKIFYIDFSPEKQITTKEQFDLYIQQTIRFKQEILQKKIDSIQEENKKKFVVSFYIALKQYYSNVIQNQTQENILPFIQVPDDLTNIIDQALVVKKVSQEQMSNLKSELSIGYLQKQDLSIEVALASINIVAHIHDIIYEDEAIISLIKQIQCYSEKPGQYGFELALNVLVLQASNKNGERKQLNLEISEMVLHQLQQEKEKKLIEESKKARKSACCNIY